MRKWIGGLVVAVVLLTSATVWAGQETYQGFSVVHVILNGTPLQTDVPAVNFFGRTVLPVRAVVEAVGGELKWDAETSTVSITTADTASLQAKLAATEAELAEVKAELEALKKPTVPAPGQPGTSRTAPAPLGTAVTVKVDNILDKATLSLTVLETIRGDEAWTRLQAANMFNTEAEAGHEYILVRAKVELVEMADPNKAYDISSAQFKAFSSAGRQYDQVFAVAPNPTIGTTLYQGASHEGWFAVAVATDDDAPVLAFGQKYDGTGGGWFSLK